MFFLFLNLSHGMVKNYFFDPSLPLNTDPLDAKGVTASIPFLPFRLVILCPWYIVDKIELELGLPQGEKGLVPKDLWTLWGLFKKLDKLVQTRYVKTLLPLLIYRKGNFDYYFGKEHKFLVHYLIPAYPWNYTTQHSFGFHSLHLSSRGSEATE